ncbi:MAG: hypothetical protein WCI89_04000, partial [bacterium]
IYSAAWVRRTQLHHSVHTAPPRQHQTKSGSKMELFALHALKRLSGGLWHKLRSLVSTPACLTACVVLYECIVPEWHRASDSTTQANDDH